MVRVAVIGGSVGFGSELQQGLVDAGATAVAAPQRWSLADVEAGLAAAAESLGGLDGVVDASPPAGSVPPRPLAETDEDEWIALAEEPLRRARHCLVAAMRVLRGGGSIVVIVPTLSMSGAAGLVPWLTATEGQRSLVRVAARAWGSSGITVNSVAVPASIMVGSSVERAGMPVAALGRGPSARSEVASVVVGLIGPGLRGVTGSTIAVDGGVWMTP